MAIVLNMSGEGPMGLGVTSTEMPGVIAQLDATSTENLAATAEATEASDEGEDNE